MPARGTSYTLQMGAVGLAAGFLSGLLGVGGGVIMVPALVLIAGFTQHRAHATSLLAVIPIAVVGALIYALDDSVSIGTAALLAVGGLVGAPLGARIMAGLRDSTLKIVFGCLGIVLGVLQVLP